MSHYQTSNLSKLELICSKLDFPSFTYDDFPAFTYDDFSAFTYDNFPDIFSEVTRCQITNLTTNTDEFQNVEILHTQQPSRGTKRKVKRLEFKEDELHFDKKKTKINRKRTDIKHENSKTICYCKRSRCIKLYCECYNRGKRCGKDCKCTNCKSSELSKQVLEHARLNFEKKKESSVCNCKKGCNSSHCECYKLGNFCGSRCKCISCGNKH